MAVVASDRLTLATLASPTYVRTYYLKQSSTLNPPGVPTANPPGGNWTTTEPTFSPNETATVYTVMLTAYGPNRNDYGPVQKSSSFEAAKQAYNQAISAGNSAGDAYQKALDAQNDLANLQIGGRNLIRDSGEFIENQRYDVKTYDLAVPTVYGHEYTYQIKGTLPEGKTRFLFYGPDGSPIGAFHEHTQDYDAGTGVYSQTFTANREVDQVRVYGYPNIQGTTTTIEWVKLERGSKATDWSPAPEDVDADIVAVGDKAKADLDALEVGGRNLLRNGDFRSESVGSWNNIPTINYDDDRAYVSQAYDWGLMFRMPVEQQTYTLSMYSRDPEELPRSRVRVSVGYRHEGENLSSEQHYGEFKPGTDWQRFNFQLTVPEGATEVQAYILNFDSIDRSVLDFSYFKLEKGSKATDWTPAPEDVDATIVAVGDKAKADLDALEIGGRNLALDSGRFIENQDYTVAFYNLATPTVPGQKYTYQIKGTLPEGRTAFMFLTSTGGNFGTSITNEVYDEETGIYSQTFTATQEVDRVRVYSYPNTPGTTTTIEWVKLERGSKATDWSPAPEDTLASLGLLADEVALKASVHYGSDEPADTSMLWVKDGVLHVYIDYGEEAYTWVNRAQGLANWTGDHEYRDGVIYLPSYTASATMPRVETGGANYFRQAILYKPVGYAETRPGDGRVYRSSSYFGADGNRVENTAGYSGNGNAAYAEEGVWGWNSWQMAGGPQVRSFNVTTSLTSGYTGDQAYIAGVHVFTGTDPYPGVFFDGNTPGFKWDGEPNASTSSYAGPGWYQVRDHDAASVIASVHKDVSEAQKKADDALEQLTYKPDKSYVDDQIIQSANGKNSITTSLNAPSGTGINGDLWRRHDSAGHVYQEFTWRDGGWKPTRVTSEMVTNMDIHKLTVSGDATFTTLVADEIWSEVVRAKLVVATELIAGDAIVKNTLSADRLKAKTITADSGVIDDLAIKEAHIGNASVTNAKIKNLDAAKITSGYIDAARIDARTITTEKLLLGSFDNFFHDPRFEDERGYSPGVVVGETLRLNAGQTVNVSWLAMPVDKDESYTVRFRKTGSGNLTFAIHSATTPSGPYSLVGDSFNTATEEGDFEFTVTADKPYIRWVVSNTTAQSFISEIKIRKVFTGIRLEDGIITTEKIQSGAVVSDSIQTDSITSEHMGANSVVATSIGANQITGNHIGAETITGTHIQAESITALNIEAEAITTDKLHAGAVTYDKIELGAVRGDKLGDITKEQFMNAIDEDLSSIIDGAETIADSVIISPGEIRLTTEVSSSGTTTNETALSLTSTRQTFIVDGKDVVYIDSEEESMNIRNVVVDDSIQVGNHIIEKVSDDITAFMWAGDRQ